LTVVHTTPVVFSKDHRRAPRGGTSGRPAFRSVPGCDLRASATAAKNLPSGGDGATVDADSGVENVNHGVDDLLGLGQLRRVLAQVEVGFSNSTSSVLQLSFGNSEMF
jgi:hypothetical protein